MVSRLRNEAMTAAPGTETRSRSNASVARLSACSGVSRLSNTSRLGFSAIRAWTAANRAARSKPIASASFASADPALSASSSSTNQRRSPKRATTSGWTPTFSVRVVLPCPASPRTKIDAPAPTERREDTSSAICSSRPKHRPGSWTNDCGPLARSPPAARRYASRSS